MKTLYYVIEKETATYSDGVEECTGHKLIRLFDIVDNKPILVTEIECRNEDNSTEEIQAWVESGLQEDEYVTHLNKEDTYLIEQL